MSKSIVVKVENEAGTKRLGQAIAESIDVGITIALIGTLGAGKTKLVQMIGTHWDIDERNIVSPTFTLCTSHEGQQAFHHIDAYRLADDDHWLELEFDELIDDGKIVFIEWADKFEHLMPKDLLKIEIDIVSEQERSFRISGTGPVSEKVVDAVEAVLTNVSIDSGEISL